MEMPRSPLSSPRGKRRILVQQDSTGPDPPKKSPIHRSAPISFSEWDSTWPASSSWNSSPRCFSPLGGSPTHRPTPSDVPVSDPSVTFDNPVAASSAPSGGRRPMLGLIGRGNSKDLMDSYFAMKRSRRRSSCKEITLQILQETTPDQNASTPQFRTVESSRRRVSIAPQLSYEDVLEVMEPRDMCTGGGRSESLDVKDAAAANLGRSLSADAYDAGAKFEERQETQALLFDSVPDLTNAENYDRFPTLRHYRRGAICYDPDLATDLLTNLSLNEDEDL